MKIKSNNKLEKVYKTRVASWSLKPLPKMKTFERSNSSNNNNNNNNNINNRKLKAMESITFITDHSPRNE